jgi:hypothetical protein
MCLLNHLHCQHMICDFHTLKSLIQDCIVALIKSSLQN